jgi:hypothetical protein
MQDVLVSREMIREWGVKADEYWKDDVFQKDLREKQVFARLENSSPASRVLLPAAFQWCPRTSTTRKAPS